MRVARKAPPEIKDWAEWYYARLVSAEEAVRHVKSGDRVVIPIGGEPRLLPKALYARREELRDVDIFTVAPPTDFGWFSPETRGPFNVIVANFIGRTATEAVRSGRVDFSPLPFSMSFKAMDERPQEEPPPDVVMCTVSQPDPHGYCSFGMAMWNKKGYIQRGKTVLAEVDGRLGRTFGDNHIHVSEIDWFVEHTPTAEPPLGRGLYGEPEARHKPIAEAVNSLLKHGDTIQIGGGTTAHAMGWLGAFEGKEDLGIHSEGLALPLAKLVKAGQFTGKYKTLHTGKAVATCFLGDEEDVAYMDSNPLFELYPVDYVNSIRTIAAHDNFVALNNALAVDLMGQVSSESVGPRMWLGAGGQVEFALGATLSKGGRSLILLPSTTHGGATRIVPTLPEGTRVTALWHFVDYVITEYGIARLLGKSQRQRIEELIAVAHPDHRAELRKAAQKLYG